MLGGPHILKAIGSSFQVSASSLLLSYLLDC